MVVGRAPVVVAVGGARRVAALPPDQVDRLAVDRQQRRSVVRLERPQVVAASPSPRLPGELDAGRVDALLEHAAVQPGSVSAFGQPEAAVPVAEPVPVRLDPDAQLQVDRLVERPAAAGSRGWPRRSRSRGGRVPEQRRSLRFESLRVCRRRRAYSAAERSSSATAACLSLRLADLDVEAVRLGTDLLEEPNAALDRARRLELVAQHRRQRQRELLPARAPGRSRRTRAAAARSWLPRPPKATPRRRARCQSPRGSVSNDALVAAVAKSTPFASMYART